MTSNGLRVLVHTVPSANVECCGIMVNAGSRDEDCRREGLAHFVEHTLFKGTSKRRAWHILNRMESVGGELNAYTNKEETTVYTVAPSGHFDRSCELLADIVVSSEFPCNELEKERDVVCDEIDSYRDVPSEMIFDEVDERLWKGSTLSHNVLGTKSTVGRFTSKDCQEWLNEMFTPANSVFYYTGAMSPCSVIKKVEKYFAAADLVVLPYISATQSGVVQIAFGFEKPVIVTKVGGLPDVVANGVTGYVIEPENSQELARTVVNFYDGKKEALFTENIKKEACRFSWERMGEVVSGFMDGSR